VTQLFVLQEMCANHKLSSTMWLKYVHVTCSCSLTPQDTLTKATVSTVSVLASPASTREQEAPEIFPHPETAAWTLALHVPQQHPTESNRLLCK
jgi:hypothetical protein